MVGNQPFYSQFTNLYSVTTLKKSHHLSNPSEESLQCHHFKKSHHLNNPWESSSSSSSLSWNLNFHCNLTDLEFVLELKVSLQPHKFRN